MSRRVKISGLCLCALLMALASGASGAQASRALLTEEAVRAGSTPAEQIEDACGVAVGPGGQIYVSDYYHRVINLFSSGGLYQSRIFAGISPEGPCALAIDPGGTLYVNYYHQAVVRLEPNPLIFDEGSSTGVAVDSAGNVYVTDRTHVAVYQPSGAPVLSGGLPLKIGLGTLDDGYGLAVSEGKVYVADASDNTVKVYEPAVEPENPSAVIGGPSGGFNSLVDAALAVDPTNGHLLVTDNLQPGFEHPEAVIEEFSPAGTFLGPLTNRIIDAEPPGLAVDSSGNLYATSGNDEGAAVFRFGPYSASFTATETAGAHGRGQPRRTEEPRCGAFGRLLCG